ncbi:hypothetical protein DSLASN_03670 [Desulfoluna limicola]|uniref:CAAX prenyl protease 2/Lysostaphin resistance protein A-like domain-containing protein n=1 Tax=Desulfoluna limicola TaxID=2810562 RepID=A0ABM7PC16_9BACT|nr:CPBP family intramembrane glutamic endopeptidase [Desulfoluna limicola]BCS94735.1 hypothetical protein DSLASN_03670 [Desulfoluna limicola]
MATKPNVKSSAAAIAIVLLMEMAVRFLPQMASPLVTTLALRLLQVLIMTTLLKGQFTEGNMGSLAPEALARAVMKGSLWSLGFGAVVGTGALILVMIGINPLHLVNMPLPKDTGTLALFFFTGGIVAPIAEELFFRGIIYRLLRPMGVAPAILISTLLFASAHAMQGMVPVPQLVGGLLFAAAFEKEGHLAVPMIIHGAGNTALFTLSLI